MATHKFKLQWLDKFNEELENTVFNEMFFDYGIAFNDMLDMLKNSKEKIKKKQINESVKDFKLTDETKERIALVYYIGNSVSQYIMNSGKPKTFEENLLLPVKGIITRSPRKTALNVYQTMKEVFKDGNIN